MSSAPFMAWRTLSVKRYPAYAMERVADPAPALAWTTSSPPNWVLFVIASSSASSGEYPGTCEKRGRMVIPACPPMTGTLISLGSPPVDAPTKVLARL